MKKKKTKHKRTVQQDGQPQKIQLGYIVSDFSAAYTRDLLPMFFAGYDRLRYELYVYHTGDVSGVEIFSQEAVLRDIGGCAAEAAAEQIRRDRIDLLVDLSLCAQDETVCAIIALRPAEHIISLAETCPTGGGSGLPRVEGVEIFPCCWSPHQGASTSYTYRTPLLDTGVPTIGVAGILPNGGTNALLEALSHLLPQLPAVRLILPATVSAGLSSEDVERIAALGSEASSLDLVDALPYDEIDVLLGIHVDLVDVCGAADHGVPLLTALPFVSHYAAHLLERLGLSAAGTVQETAAQICALCADPPRLAEYHQLLHWRLFDLSDAGNIMFSVERAYERALVGDSSESAQAVAEQLAQAAAREHWSAVIAAAHRLDGWEKLLPEQRMTLAWAYFFCDAPTLAGRWALAAEGLPREREGARLYLSFVSPTPPGTPMECYARARHGLSQIEDGLPVNPEVHAVLLKICADNGTFSSEPEESWRYALAYAREAGTPFMQRAYYGAALFKLNALDLPAREVYETSRGYAELFRDVQPYTHHGRRKKDKIRIGYISGDFCEHVMLYFVWPFLAGFDSDQFEVYVYNLGKHDQYSTFLQSLVTEWRNLSDHARDMERIAREIHADEVDILFDLAGHTADSGLAAFAWKPAPVQISGLGYMATTGLPAVDYFVTDRYCDPEGSGSESVYVEKLLRLTSQFCYNGYTNLPVSTGTPARMKGYIQFASFNQYAKLRDDMLLAWREIMERVPNARLLLKNKAYGRRGVVAALQERLRGLGFDMNRVMFEVATRDYMQRYLDVDIALDTFPWPGGGTSCDALYMGVPVVSYYTERHSTRFTYSLLANMGLADLASTKLEDYIATAVALAGDIDLLDALHRELRTRMKASPVMDQERYIREMEDCYRAIWAAWEAREGSV